MKYKADKDLDLQYGNNRIHFDADEEKDLNLSDEFELPEGLNEVKKKQKIQKIKSKSK